LFLLATPGCPSDGESYHSLMPIYLIYLAIMVSGSRLSLDLGIGRSLH